MGQFATRLSSIEGRPPVPPSSTGDLPIYGLPGYGGIPAVAPPTSSTVIHTASGRGVPIHQIQFPHSSSPIPELGASPSGVHDGGEDDADGVAVLHFYKLSFPTFDGKEDPLGWQNRCDHFFRSQRTRDADKVWLASFHITGVAQQWYYMLEREVGEISWSDFKDLCNQRFGPALGTNHLSDLARLPFRSSVAEYVETFLDRMAHAGYLTPAQQVLLFTRGLPELVKVDVELHRPTDLQSAMALARAYECRATAFAALGAPKSSRLSGKFQQHLPSASVQSVVPVTPSPQSSSVVPPHHKPFKCLTPVEMVERRRQGLCYNCDEQYVRGHKCSRLFYLEVTDFLEDDDQVHDNSTQSANDETPLISLNAITGVKTPYTMQVYVHIGSQQYIALLDTGSTHKFVSRQVADQVGLRFGAPTGSTVTVANGDHVPCSGLAKDVAIRIGDEFFSIDCYSIPLDCYDMVLGIKYLRTLGPILWDLDDLCMAFTLHGRRVFWKGIGSSHWDIPPTSTVHSMRHSESELLERLLHTFNNVFESPTGLPPSRSSDHRIHLKPNVELVAVRPYRYPQLQKDELEAQCETMLQQGVIRPSTSPFSAPVLLVKKHDGTWRFCVDYRALNDATIKDKFPIPVVEELLDELNGAKYFTNIDLRLGYHQVRVHPDDIAKTAFRTHHGRFEFLVMPFGLSNAPSTFQALMNTVLKPFLRRFVLVFFDDILIYSRSYTEHLQHLRCVLEVLQSNDLRVKRSKCSFAETSVAYLGHTISASGVAMDQAKVQAGSDWPQPKSARGLRGFLGLAGYYRHFIHNFGSIAEPLTQLLKKDAFQWTVAATEAFQHLKAALTAAPVLQLPDFGQSIIVKCDASCQVRCFRDWLWSCAASRSRTNCIFQQAVCSMTHEGGFL